MDFINKLEATVAGWTKNVPHLPASAQKWIAANAWWIVLIGAILSGISVLVILFSTLAAIAVLASVSAGTFDSFAGVGITGFTIAAAFVGLAFTLIRAFIMAIAVKPLKDLQKKGWVLLFVVWLIQALSVVVGSVLTFSIGGFFVGLIFGAIGLAIGGYFLFEIRGQFAHTTKAAAKKA